MNGERVVIDTNILVDYAKGVEAMKHVIEGVEAHISIITEIEFLSWSGLTDDRIADARLFLNEFSSSGISDAIRDRAAWIKRHHKMKLPDAVIAATALHLNAPLITRDKGFNKLPT